MAKSTSKIRIMLIDKIKKAGSKGVLIRDLGGGNRVYSYLYIDDPIYEEITGDGIKLFWCTKDTWKGK